MVIEHKLLYGPVLALCFLALVSETYKIIADIARALFKLSKSTARYRGFLSNHTASRVLLLRENSFSLKGNVWLLLPFTMILLMVQAIPPIIAVSENAIELPLAVFFSCVLIYVSSYAFQIWKRDRSVTQLLQVFDVEKAGFIIAAIIPAFVSSQIAINSHGLGDDVGALSPVLRAPILILPFLLTIFALPYVGVSWDLADIAEGSRRILIRWFEIGWMAFVSALFLGVWTQEKHLQFFEIAIKTLIVLFFRDLITQLIPQSRRRELMFRGMRILAPLSLISILISIIWGRLL